MRVHEQECTQLVSMRTHGPNNMYVSGIGAVVKVTDSHPCGWGSIPGKSCSFLIVSLSKSLSLCCMCSDQHVKYRMPRGFPSTSSLLLDYHGKQYTHTYLVSMRLHEPEKDYIPCKHESTWTRKDYIPCKHESTWTRWGILRKLRMLFPVSLIKPNHSFSSRSSKGLSLKGK